MEKYNYSMGFNLNIEIMYFGRPSEFLLMTSERVKLPHEIVTTKFLFDKLRARDDRWAYELDDSHVIFTINEIKANYYDVIRDGDTVGISSIKSIFEI